MTRVLTTSRILEQVSPQPVPETGLDALLAASRAAARLWREVSLRDRVRRLRRLREELVRGAADLALESGAARSRPAAEAMVSEVLPLVEACRFLERKAPSILRPTRPGWWGRPLWMTGVGCEIHREPLGLILIIAPSNYPLFIPGVQALQSLAAGNAVWVKPAPGCAAPMNLLQSMLARAGIHPDLFAVLPASREAGETALQASVDKVLFTGSADTGRGILRRLAPRLLPATLELSGSDPVLVREDADLPLVARALAFGLTLNGGHTCVAPRRVYVHRKVHGSLETLLAEELHPRFQPSPIPRELATRLLPMLCQAFDQGARVVTGGLRPDGTLIAPLVLANTPPGIPLLQEDWFLPILSLVPVGGDDEAVGRANDSRYHLGAAVFSGDEPAARLLALRINAGVVCINDLILPTADPRVPFGGRGQSGFGATRGAEGLLELTTPKAVTCTRGTRRPAYQEPEPGDGLLFQGYLNLAHGRGLAQRLQGLKSIAAALSRRRPPQPRKKKPQ